MASQKISITSYFSNRRDAVEFVEDTLPHLNIFSALTMIIRPVGLEGYYVSFVIDMLSVNTETLDYLQQRLSILGMKQNSSFQSKSAKERNLDLEENVCQFFEILDIQETSDEGRIFNPNFISSCRVLDTAKLNEILEIMKEQSGYKRRMK